jgi:putative integral membrane protein (TIGR02587 family)
MHRSGSERSLNRASGRSGPHAGGWQGELDGVLRGLTGGFLIGIPLIYTMETWQAGQTISPAKALVFLVCAYALNFGFVTFAGFHRAEPGSVRPAGDALEATALAIVAAAVSLALLHQIEPVTPLNVAIGRIAVNTLPISIGVSIANHLLGQRESRTGSGDGERDEPAHQGAGRAVALDLGAAFGGALFLAVSIAPTDEVPVLATEVPVAYLPFLILFSLVVSYGIVFVAGFGGEERRLQSAGPFQRPITETVLAYLMSLLTAAALLVLFGQIDRETDWALAYAQVVILGLPATIGGAAGRLAA